MTARLRAEQLRQVATQLGTPALPELVKSPTVSEALRLTIAWAEGPRRPPDQAATLMMHHNQVWLEVRYLLPALPPAPREAFPLRRYRTLTRALLGAGFTRLDDQPALTHGGDLWLLARASANHYHDIVLTPGAASGVYYRLVEVVRVHWPEALRELLP